MSENHGYEIMNKDHVEIQFCNAGLSLVQCLDEGPRLTSLPGDSYHTLIISQLIKPNVDF